MAEVRVKEVNGKTSILFPDNNAALLFLDKINEELSGLANSLWCAVSLRSPLVVFKTEDFKKYIQSLV